MGECGICGHEMGSAPYREPAPKKKIKEEAPKMPQVSLWERICRSPTLFTTLGGVYVSALIFVVGRLAYSMQAQNFAVGLLAFSALVPVVVKVPILVSMMDSDNKGKDDSNKWESGVGIMFVGAIILAVIGAVGCGAFWLITHMGMFIASLL